MTTLLTGVNGGTFPNQTTGPAAGEFITAASINNGLQGVLNECKHLFDIKANLAGATFTGLVTCNAGLTIPNAAVLTIANGGDVTVASGGAIAIASGGALDVQSGSTLTIENGADLDIDPTGQLTSTGTVTIQDPGTLQLYGQTQHRDPQRPADPNPAVTLTVDAEDGDTVILPVFTGVGTPACTIADGQEGWRITILMPKTYIDLEVPLFCEIKRSSGSIICTLATATIINGFGGTTDAFAPSWIECQVEGGVWRARKYCGPLTPGASW